MLTDRFGLQLSTTSRAAAESYRLGVDLALAGRTGGIRHLEDAVAADPDFAVAASYLGFLLRTGTDPARGEALARASVDRAESATPREQSQVLICALLTERRSEEARQVTIDHLGHWPADTVAMAYCHVLFNLFNPDPRRREHWLEVAADVHGAVGEDWFFDGALAFVLEENAQYAESRRLAERSLAANPDHGGAAHTMAHAFYELGDLDEGQAWLTEFLERWEGEGGRLCHLTWHRALLQLAGGNPCAEDLEAILGAAAVGRLTDGASLLWRLHIAGFEDLPWHVLDVPRVPVTATFPAWHQAIAAAGSGDRDRLAELRAELAPLVEAGRADSAYCDNLTAALEHYVDGEYDAAAQRLLDGEDTTPSVGGSRAQLEVWDDTLIDALARSGRQTEASARLRRRLERRPTERDKVWMETIEAQ